MVSPQPIKTVFVDPEGKPHTPDSFEEISWRISGYAVVELGGKFLMIIPSQGKQWEFPGGGVKRGEAISLGIKREVLEESGYSIELLSPTPFYIGEANFYHPKRKKFLHAVHLFYEAKLATSEQDKEKIKPDMTKTVEWVDLKTLSEETCHMIYRPVVKLLQGRLK